MEPANFSFLTVAVAGLIAIICTLWLHDGKKSRRAASIEINPSGRSLDSRASHDKMIKDTTLGFLPCGARILKMSNLTAKLKSIWVDNGDDKFFREGDLIINCHHDCACFEVCPLIKTFVDARRKDDLERLAAKLIDGCRTVDGKCSLPGVHDQKIGRPEESPKAQFVKAFIVKNNRGEHIIVPPMLLEVNDGDNGRNSRGNGGHGHDDVGHG